MPTPWPHPCPVTTNVAFGASGARRRSPRAFADAPVAQRTRTAKRSASGRCIDGTPKSRQPAPRTRTRLANRLTSSGFLYGIVTSRVNGSPRGFLHRSALLQRKPPLAIVAIPVDGLGKPGVEIMCRRPSELALDLAGIQQIPAVVAGPVGNDRLQFRR